MSTDLDQWDFSDEATAKCGEVHPTFGVPCEKAVTIPGGPPHHYGSCYAWLDDYGALWWRSANFAVPAG